MRLPVRGSRLRRRSVQASVAPDKQQVVCLEFRIEIRSLFAHYLPEGWKEIRFVEERSGQLASFRPRAGSSSQVVNLPMPIDRIVEVYLPCGPPPFPRTRIAVAPGDEVLFLLVPKVIGLFGTPGSLTMHHYSASEQRWRPPVELNLNPGEVN